MRDAYERFFKAFNISTDEFFDFGIDEIIHVPLDRAAIEWKELRTRVETGGCVTVRGFGRNGRGNSQFLDFYANVFGHWGFAIDPTNNAAPTRVLQRLTGYSKTRRAGCEHLANYQVSHVFGRTKNPYAFTAPWNIVYIPKIVDPFTGHEAPGDLAAQFQMRFRRHMRSVFQPLIDDYNCAVTASPFAAKIDDYVASSETDSNFASALRDAFAPIEIMA
jgi:hypothetical protein